MLFSSGPVDLNRLLERCRAGDSRAWDQLVDAHQSLVYSIPRRFGLSAEDSADVFQATFLALYRSLDKIESGRKIPKWLSVTASREALRLKRITSRTVSDLQEESLGLDEILADEEATAEETAIKAVQSDELRAAIGALGEKCRALLTLLYLMEGVSYQEVSDRLQMPVGAIGPTRARCLDRLRQDLEKAGFFDAGMYQRSGHKTH